MIYTDISCQCHCSYLKEVDSKSKKFIFLDDNIVGNRKYARQLFEAIIPLKINWIGQASISFANDIEMMKLAKKSGCVGLFIGLERVVDNNDQRFKKLGKLDDTIDALKKIRKMGIIIMASVIFGFDDDTPDIFDNTLNAINDWEIEMAEFHILTPFPGTVLFNRLKNEDRILTEEWDKYTYTNVVFKPKNMSIEELFEGTRKVAKKYYSISKIFKRSFKTLETTKNLYLSLYVLQRNFRYRERYKNQFCF